MRNFTHIEHSQNLACIVTLWRASFYFCYCAFLMHHNVAQRPSVLCQDAHNSTVHYSNFKLLVSSERGSQKPPGLYLRRPPVKHLYMGNVLQQLRHLILNFGKIVGSYLNWIHVQKSVEVLICNTSIVISKSSRSKGKTTLTLKLTNLNWHVNSVIGDLWCCMQMYLYCVFVFIYFR